MDLGQFCDGTGVLAEQQEAGGGPLPGLWASAGLACDSLDDNRQLASGDSSPCSRLHEVWLTHQESEVHRLSCFHTLENTFFEWVFGKKMHIDVSLLPIRCC